MHCTCWISSPPGCSTDTSAHGPTHWSNQSGKLQGDIEGQDQHGHQQMHVSESVGTLVSSHVLEASSPVKSWYYGGTAGFFRMKNILHPRKSQKILWVMEDLLEDLVSPSFKMLEGSNCQHTLASCHQEMETRMKTKEMRSAVLPSLLSINQCHPATEGTTSLSVPSNWQKTHCKNYLIFAPLAQPYH